MREKSDEKYTDWSRKEYSIELYENEKDSFVCQIIIIQKGTSNFMNEKVVFQYLLNIFGQNAK
jgi:hypothetical protein